MNHTNDITYKAVVTLNNAGVTLIQHHRYMEGVLTLKDSLELIKNAFAADEEQHEQVNKTLHRAWHRANKIYEDKRSSPKADILVVTDHATPFDVFNELERNPSKLCCVKIDPMELESRRTSDGFNEESSIIMYNYGIALLLLSMSGDYDPTVYTQNSYQLFELSRCVIDMHLTNSDALNIPSSVLLVSMLTNMRMYQISMLTQHDPRATTTLKYLEWVLSAIFIQQRVYHMISPAAAACA